MKSSKYQEKKNQKQLQIQYRKKDKCLLYAQPIATWVGNWSKYHKIVVSLIQKFKYIYILVQLDWTVFTKIQQNSSITHSTQTQM